MDNTNLACALAGGRAEVGNQRETFFFNQMRMSQDVTASPVSDFQIDARTFEIGGRKKGQRQIVDIPDGYIVRDDIEFGYANIIPLWAFGLTY